MPSVSRNERRKRRLRRNVTLMGRELRQVNARHLNAHFTLLAMLVNANGAIVIAPDMAAAAMKDMRFLNWQTQRQEDGSMRVSLLDSRTPPVEAIDLAEEASDRPDRSVTAQLMGRPVDDTPADAEPGEHDVVTDAITEHITGDVVA